MGVINSTILALLQDQYKHELSNSLRYYARASWASYRGFENTAKYFRKEAEGENGHAEKVREYIEARNEALLPEGFKYEDTSNFQNFDDLFTTALAVEQLTTEKLENIYAEAMKTGDYMTSNWLKELIDYQVVEENEYQTIIDRIVQRGGGGNQAGAFEAFRKDISAAHDIDVWVGELE